MHGNYVNNVVVQSQDQLRILEHGNSIIIFQLSFDLTTCGIRRHGIMETISNLAVIVNAGLVAFTGTYAIDETWTARVWIFVGMACAVFM
jgi:hypothetical protein